MIERLEPFAYGYINSKSEDVGMKIAEGIFAMCKYTPLTIDPEIGLGALDRTAGKSFQDALGVAYACGDGIIYSKSNFEKKIEAYPECRDELLKYSEFFSKLDTYSIVDSLLNEHEKKLIKTNSIWCAVWGGHANPDFGLVGKIGTDGIRAHIEEYRKKNPERDVFYDSLLLTLDGLDLMGERLCTLAGELAISDPENAEIYKKVENALLTVPKKPAYDFMTAVQAFYLTFTLDGKDSPACFDQYMINYWRKTEYKEARRILEGLWQGFHKARSWNLCISGSDEHGRDLTNELSYEILDIAAKYKYNTPNLTMRCHKGTPDALYEKAIKTLSTGIGMPVFYNDDVVCPALEDLGIPPEDSHRYVMNGCNQFDIFGKSHMGLEDGEVCLLKALEYTLHRGRCLVTDEVLSIDTGDPCEFKSFDELVSAYKKQVEYLTGLTVKGANLMQRIFSECAPNPYRSCLIEGCIEKGIDYKTGGPIYNHGQILAEGLADTTDSLAAIKHFVFDTKKFTMKELVDALANDFNGREDMRLTLASFEGKFGNDIEWVDNIGGEVLNHFFETLLTHRTWRGGENGIYGGGLSTFQRTGRYGRTLGASANGRHKSDIYIADSCGACPGKDTYGPTALINSVLHYNHRLAKSGFVLQVKFDKKSFATDSGLKAFLSLVKTYFLRGGQQLTVNVLSRDELLDAVEHPERHGDLVVRVGGFSAMFTALEPDLQKNIIARTEHNF